MLAIVMMLQRWSIFTFLLILPDLLMVLHGHKQTALAYYNNTVYILYFAETGKSWFYKVFIFADGYVGLVPRRAESNFHGFSTTKHQTYTVSITKCQGEGGLAFSNITRGGRRGGGGVSTIPLLCYECYDIRTLLKYQYKM